MSLYRPEHHIALEIVDDPTSKPFDAIVRMLAKNTGRQTKE